MREQGGFEWDTGEMERAGDSKDACRKMPGRSSKLGLSKLPDVRHRLQDSASGNIHGRTFYYVRDIYTQEHDRYWRSRNSSASVERL